MKTLIRSYINLLKIYLMLWHFSCRSWMLLIHIYSVLGFAVFFYWITVTSLSVSRNVRATNVLPGNHYDAATSIEALETDDVTNRIHVDVRFTKIPWADMFRCKPVIALSYCCFSFYLLYYSSPLVTEELGFAAGGSVFIWSLPQVRIHMLTHHSCLCLNNPT